MKLKNGQTLHIRTIQVDDVDDVLSYMKQVNTETKNLMRESDEFTMTREQEIAFIEKNLVSNNHYMIGAFIDDTLVSVSGFYGGDLKRIRHRVTIGMSVLKAYHGLHIGTYMLEALISEAKRRKKTKIDLEVRCDNVPAVALYKKFKFIIEGTIRRGFYVDDTYVDLYQMGYIMEEK